eukprot:g6254.t1
MTTIDTYDKNSNNKNNDAKMNTRKIKINFEGTARDVDLPSPITLSRLQQAIASTFDTAMPARSGANEAVKDSDLSFTYKDPEGDDIVFDKDSELSLALRLCPSSLEITAAVKETAAKKPDPERRLYSVAARNLREYNGVPSMTPEKLIKTLAFLQLNPRRLVRQSLAPKSLLVRMTAAEGRKKEGETQPQPQPLGGDKSNNEDLSESVTAGMELMSVEDDKKEWNDGFMSVEPAEAVGPDNAAAAGAAKDPAPEKNVLHRAFVSAGIRLRPREVRPLLLALDVRPRRLVKLGHVDAKHLGPMLEAAKKAARKRSGGSVSGDTPGPRQRMARGCCARGVGGPGGKPCGRRMVMMRSNLHPAAHAPPLPQAPVFEGAEDRMVFVPVKRGGGGRRGPLHGPPQRKRHGRHAGGPEEGMEGAGSHRGQSRRGMMGLRGGRQRQHQQEHGYYHSG